MLRSEVTVAHKFTPITFKDRRICISIAIVTIIQCIAVFVLGATVLLCVWNVNKHNSELGNIARVLYLFDAEACGVGRTHEAFDELILDDVDTSKFNVQPLKRRPPVIPDSPKLASDMRIHVTGSIVIHAIWMLIATFVVIVCHLKDINFSILKYTLFVFIYSFVIISFLDVSMGIAYISHIQRSLTIAMVLRCSGWIRLQVADKYSFGGWVPLIMGFLWMRGIVILAMNIYFAGMLRTIKRNISGREYRRKFMIEANMPIPEPKPSLNRDSKSLYYRMNEDLPFNIKSE